MRLLILSDLHREVWRDASGPARDALSTMQPNPAVSRPDVVVLAGDMDVGQRAVAWADETFPHLPVIYVHGNHEGYGHNLDSLRKELSARCAETGHIHYLDRGEVIVAGVRFLGATLWTDFQLLGSDRYQASMEEATIKLNDYRRVRLARAGYRRIRPIDTVQWHSQDRLWLQERLNEPYQGRTIVVTHMAPSGRSIPERYREQLLSAAFASNLDALVMKSDLWIHGHVHDSLDYTVGVSRVVCNPLGYPLSYPVGARHWENDLYDPNYVVDVG